MLEGSLGAGVSVGGSSGVSDMLMQGAKRHSAESLSGTRGSSGSGEHDRGGSSASKRVRPDSSRG